MPCSTNAMVHTEGAVSADCEADKSTEANEASLSSKLIIDGILALKGAAVWSKELKTPAFNAEAATVYLNVLPKEMLNQFSTRAVSILYLPHPLSLNRSVCYIGNDVETEGQQAKMTQNLKEAGVLGKIKVVPMSLLQLAFKTNDLDALAELPELYDSYYFNHKTCYPMLAPRLAKKKNWIARVKKGNFAPALRTSAFWVNSENNGYIAKVGHTGLTDEQLQQNIAAALDYIKVWDDSFPKGIGSVRSVQIKTGTSEAVSIHQDDSDEVATDVDDEMQLAVSAEVITEAISRLKAAPSWPKEESAPEFIDKFATAYLNVFPKMKNLPSDTYFGVLRLPHPLSLNRRVCYIGNDVETEEQQAEMTQKLKEAGVLGKIKIIPGSLVEKAVTDGEEAAITQLVDLYDTHLVEKQIRTTLHWKKLLPAFLKNKKYALDAVPSDFETSLKKSSIWMNSSKNGFFAKVGHSGLTEEQLQQNIAAAMDFFKRWDVFFPKGSASVKSVQLRSGTGKGISILQDGHFKVEQPKSPVGDGKKSSVVGKKAAVANDPTIVKEAGAIRKKTVAGKKTVAVANDPTIVKEAGAIRKKTVAGKKTVAVANDPTAVKEAGAIKMKTVAGKKTEAVANDPTAVKKAGAIKKKTVAVAKELAIIGEEPAIVKKKAGANKKKLDAIGEKLVSEGKNPGAIGKKSAIVGKKAGDVAKEPSVDVSTSVVSGKKSMRVKHKRPAEAEQGAGPRPPKQRREC